MVISRIVIVLLEFVVNFVIVVLVEMIFSIGCINYIKSIKFMFWGKKE